MRVTTEPSGGIATSTLPRSTHTLSVSHLINHQCGSQGSLSQTARLKKGVAIGAEH